MSGLRNLFVLSGIAMSIALPQLALSADESTSDSASAIHDKVKIDETKRHDRGFAFTPLNESSGVQMPVSATVKKPADNIKPVETSAVKKTPVGKVAKVQQVKQPAVISAVQKPKHEASKASMTASANQTGKAVRTTTAAVPATESNSLLVKFSPCDGASVISARLDKNGNLPTYKVGDKMVVNVKANQDCNVVVFNYDSTGTLTQIFPNDYQQNGFVKSGESVEIGGPDSPFDYQIAGKGGPEKVFVYAYPTGSDFHNPLTAMGPTTAKVAMAPIAGTPFRGAEMTVDEYRKLVNSSQVFFSRSVEVKPRAQHSAQLVSNAAAASPNKVELTFTVDK